MRGTDPNPALKLNAQARVFVPKAKAVSPPAAAHEELRPTQVSILPSPSSQPIPSPVSPSTSKSLNVGAREFRPRSKVTPEVNPPMPTYYPMMQPPYGMYMAPAIYEDTMNKGRPPHAYAKKAVNETTVQPPKEERQQVQAISHVLEKEVKEPVKAPATEIPPKAADQKAAEPNNKAEKLADAKVEESKAPSVSATSLDKKPSKVYDVSYLQQFRPKCQRRPKDMRVIEIPLKSNINIKFEPYEEVQRSEAAETVRNLRILLNKLARDNFARISDSILNNFSYNAEILGELAHILFNKCVKEHAYIDVYMQLADQLFRKFRGTAKPGEGGKAAPQQQQLNFRKIFIERCQSTFEEKSTEEFLKELPTDIDEEEKSLKKRQRMVGNTKLIGQLFIRGTVPDVVVKTCFERLFKDPKEDNIENLCHLFLTIGKGIYEKFAYDAQQTTNKRVPKIKLKLITKELFDDYVDKLVALKQMDKMPSRVKFMIQDVIDARNEEWNNAFDKFPVPAHQGKPRDGVVEYRKKTRSIEKPEPPVPETKVDLPPDPKLVQHELRKKSMNEQNVFGRNIEKFQKTQLDDRVRVLHYIVIVQQRRLYNAVDEYLGSKSLTEVADTVAEVVDNEKLPRCICVGHFLLWGFSKGPKDFTATYKMVIDLHAQKHIDTVDIEEGIVVTLANFFDTLIDNPNSPALFKEMISAFEAQKIINKELVLNCQTHIEAMRKQLDEEYQH